MKKTLVVILMFAAAMLGGTTAQAATPQRSIGQLFYDYGYKGTSKYQYVNDQGDCDSSGYRIVLSGAIGPWGHNLTSLKGDSLMSPHCNYVIMHNMNSFSGADQGYCGEQYLPIYNVAQVGSCKNDSIYSLQFVYRTGGAAKVKNG